jgi:hypothetical protein
MKNQLWCRQGSAIVLIAGSVLLAPEAGAQASSSQLGFQQRADAARDLIILAIQQGISSLPPTSGQSFTYTFDAELGTFVPSTVLGPTSFRSTQTVGKGMLSLRAAFSYFDLSEDFGPIDYKVLLRQFPDPPGFCTRFGLDVNSNVGLFNFATNYGITDRIEVDLNVPIVLSNTSASQTFPSDDGGQSVRIDQCAKLGQDGAPIVSVPFSGIALPGGQSVDFNEGTNVGVGRISIGAKWLFYATDQIDVAFFPEFSFPSPSQAEYAGSDSPAILPRVVFRGKVDPVRIHVDVGYDYDFDNDTLRRFSWDTGLSLPITSPQSTFDVGMGGSVFNQGIQWTPPVAPILDENGQQVGAVRALADTRLGNNFVDFLAGVKFRLTDHSVVSGAVNVPVNDEGFRAAVVGTVAFEYYLL